MFQLAISQEIIPYASIFLIHYMFSDKGKLLVKAQGNQVLHSYMYIISGIVKRERKQNENIILAKLKIITFLLIL